MNNKRCQAIRAINAQLEGALDELEALHTEEHRALENLPRDAMESANGQQMAAAESALNDALAYLTETIRSLIEATGDDA